MKLIVVGCGRIGSELAHTVVQQGHNVTVIDPDIRAFERLGTHFSGRVIQGTYLDQNVLQRAGIENTDGLAAVTADDATNFVVARAAKEIYGVPNVVARTYDPLRRMAFETLGIQVVASSSWGAQRINQVLTHPGNFPLVTLGHGEVNIIEETVDAHLQGKTLSEIRQAGSRYPAAVIRGGKAMLPIPELVLMKGDLLISSQSGQVSESTPWKEA